MHCADIETLLTYSLDTLRTLGGTSIMSRKAHRCLQRYLHFLKPLVFVGEKQSPSQGSLPPPAPDMEWTSQTPVMGDVMQHEFSTEVIASCIDDMFGSLNPNDFNNMGFVGLGLGISDFDASGFI
ncbi:hypothetical protein CDD82_2783 [Ophiocordyceps australis]|uniref:Uncharacterized protein n=1 Tax=Ophiocordyceps australis TaxID=1399860 RepID=A0A2C5XVN0_9HYPO|nr:hypothetical protein CDD82_2783 [Ophiocordyceps australis]